MVMIEMAKKKDMFKQSLTKDNFSRLSGLITSQCGIKMPDVKKLMLEGRLRKRLRSLEMETFDTYCEYLFSEEGMERELVHMIDVVTTNKTDFVREPAHFEFLTEKALPALVQKTGAGIDEKLTVWSAGCATGEEPYTIAMFIDDFAKKHGYKVFDSVILATDISTRVLDAARRGIYKEEKIEPVPDDMKKRYLMRGKGRQKGLVRIAPELREQVKFRRLNFMDEDFGFRETIDMIFCRNVIIYFDRPTQEIFLHKIVRHLAVGGYLFIGHAETLNYMNIPLAQVAPSVYMKVS